MQNTEIKNINPDRYTERLNLIENIVNENNEEQENKFIDSELQRLDSDTEKKMLSLMSNNFYEGYINSHSEVKRTFMFDGFMVDDPDLYKELFKTIRMFKQTPGWENMPFRQIALNAVQWTLHSYFGNALANQNTEQLNRDLYMNHISVDSENIHLSELKGKALAVCAEKAASAQNLIVFLGLDSYLVFSPESKLMPDNDKGEAHAYNIIKSDNGLTLYDPTNLARIGMTPDGKQNYGSYLYKLTEEQFETLKTGGEVPVTIKESVVKDGKIEEVESTRIYGGAKQ